VERLLEYLNVPIEEDLFNEEEYEKLLPANLFVDSKAIDVIHPHLIDKSVESTEWPTRGKVEFDNVSLRYFKSLEPSLLNVTFKIEPGTKLGNSVLYGSF
jgi:ABC-type multidrug transport system fused ATPase/permease subunit